MPSNMNTNNNKVAQFPVRNLNSEVVGDCEEHPNGQITMSLNKFGKTHITKPTEAYLDRITWRKGDNKVSPASSLGSPVPTPSFESETSTVVGLKAGPAADKPAVEEQVVVPIRPKVKMGWSPVSWFRALKNCEGRSLSTLITAMCSTDMMLFGYDQGVFGKSAVSYRVFRDCRLRCIV